MAIHTRAFGDMRILIYGNDPLVPMKLEQTFAKVSPANELKFDSFENYEQAYDFAKDMKNVGLVFILENCGEVDLSSLLKQFTKLNEDHESCFGVLVHGGEESFKGLRTLRSNPDFLDYVTVEDLLDVDKCSIQLQDIWTKYQDAFESKVIPAPLGNTYQAMAHHHASEESINLAQRLSQLLGNEMNITWKESLILRWAPVIDVLSANESDVLAANKPLAMLYNQLKVQADLRSLSEIASSEIGIAQKVALSASILTQAASSKSLEALLLTTLREVGPRSKPLLRTIKKHQSAIIEISAQVLSGQGLKKSKAV